MLRAVGVDDLPEALLAKLIRLSVLSPQHGDSAVLMTDSRRQKIRGPRQTFAVLVFLAFFAGSRAEAQWIEKPGKGWLQAVVYHLDTTEEFGPTGDTQDFFADGHVVSTSLFVTAAVGLTRGVDAWGQLPLHRLEFNDAAGDRDKTGVGDPRLFLRLGPELFGVSNPGPLAVAIRGGVKFPGAEFPVDAEVIPLTEGQRDWELLLEVGTSFYPRPLYAYGWVGYRWREENEKIQRDPGDERLAFAAVGGELGRLTWQFAAEGLWGLTPMIEGIPTVTARRKIIQLFPKVGWKLGPGAVELGGRIPVDGQNLPAGSALTLGYFTTW
jgi:hypothetical protein